MKTVNTKSLPILAIEFSALFMMGCSDQASERREDTEAIFPKGELGPATNFTGKAWAFGLVKSDTTYNTLAGNVYFEPGARSNWHTHSAGQILVITAGMGYHQTKGNHDKPFEADASPSTNQNQQAA